MADCHVWLSRVPANPALRFGLLDEVERARCSRFLNGRDLALFVTGRALAKSGVGHLAGIPRAVTSGSTEVFSTVIIFRCR